MTGAPESLVFTWIAICSVAFFVLGFTVGFYVAARAAKRLEGKR